MKLREIIVKNFRCLVDVAIPIADIAIQKSFSRSGHPLVCHSDEGGILFVNVRKAA